MPSKEVVEDVRETSNPSAGSEQFEFWMRLGRIFMPQAHKQSEEFYGSKAAARFVHYTSAEAAINIIRSKRVWMRNTTCMADYREVQHGFDMLAESLKDEARRKSLEERLDDLSPNLAQEAFDFFRQWWTNIRSSTYVTSISEHDDSEDVHGRLSMWRAFGGNAARVAIVLRLPWASNVTQALNLMFSPVAYLKQQDVDGVFATVLDNIRAEREFLHPLDRGILVNTVFNMLLAGVTCLKHEGFREEREWRVIYGPDRAASPLMESAIEVVGAIPQTVYKIPLDAKKSDALSDLDLPRIFDRLIIGPSQFPWVMYEAFYKELKEVGVDRPEERISISGIPIRSYA